MRETLFLFFLTCFPLSGKTRPRKTKRAHCAHLSVVLFNDRMVTNCPIDLLYIYSLTTKQDNVKRYAKVAKRLFMRSEWYYTLLLIYLKRVNCVYSFCIVYLHVTRFDRLAETCQARDVY